ncbi:MAG: hypothetical protein Q8P95_00085 [bacterium]|nr:hypothetical protein [bacterium]
MELSPDISEQLPITPIPEQGRSRIPSHRRSVRSRALAALTAFVSPLLLSGCGATATAALLWPNNSGNQPPKKTSQPPDRPPENFEGTFRVDPPGDRVLGFGHNEELGRLVIESNTSGYIASVTIDIASTDTRVKDFKLLEVDLAGYITPISHGFSGMTVEPPNSTTIQLATWIPIQAGEPLRLAVVGTSEDVGHQDFNSITLGGHTVLIEMPATGERAEVPISTPGGTTITN